MYCKRGKVLYPLTWRKKISKILCLGKKNKVQNLVSAPFLWGWGDGYWNLHFYLLHRYKETQERHTKWLLSHIAGRRTTVQTTLENNLRGSSNAEGVHISTPAIPTYSLHPRETRTPRPGDPHENAHWTLPVTVSVQANEGKKLDAEHVQFEAIYVEILNTKNNIISCLWVQTL